MNITRVYETLRKSAADIAAGVGTYLENGKQTPTAEDPDAITTAPGSYATALARGRTAGTLSDMGSHPGTWFTSTPQTDEPVSVVDLAKIRAAQAAYNAGKYGAPGSGKYNILYNGLKNWGAGMNYPMFMRMLSLPEPKEYINDNDGESIMGPEFMKEWKQMPANEQESYLKDMREQANAGTATAKTASFHAKLMSKIAHASHSGAQDPAVQLMNKIAACAKAKGKKQSITKMTMPDKLKKSAMLIIAGNTASKNK